MEDKNSRRDFLKGTGFAVATAAGAGFLSGLTGPAEAQVREVYDNAFKELEARPLEGMFRQMTSEQFGRFFDDLVGIVTDPKRSNESVKQILERHKVRMKLPENVSRLLTPVLGITRGKITRRVGRTETTTMDTASKCGACGACGVCGACGGVNNGAVGATAAAIWAFGLTVSK